MVKNERAMNVLIVDDEMTVAETMQYMLERLGYTIEKRN